MDKNIPGEEEISKAVLWLQLHRARGPYGMRAEYLRMWLCTEMQEEDPDLGNWENVASIIQEDFRGVELLAACGWKIVVMISKGVCTNFRVIGLAEVLWKAISGFINLQISSSIQFHDALHGFHVGRGTGTTTFEAKIL